MLRNLTRLQPRAAVVEQCRIEQDLARGIALHGVHAHRALHGVAEVIEADAKEEIVLTPQRALGTVADRLPLVPGELLHRSRQRRDRFAVSGERLRLRQPLQPVEGELLRISEVRDAARRRRWRPLLLLEFHWPGRQRGEIRRTAAQKIASMHQCVLSSCARGSACAIGVQRWRPSGAGSAVRRACWRIGLFRGQQQPKPPQPVRRGDATCEHGKRRRECHTADHRQRPADVMRSKLQDQRPQSARSAQARRADVLADAQNRRADVLISAEASIGRGSHQPFNLRALAAGPASKGSTPQVRYGFISVRRSRPRCPVRRGAPATADPPGQKPPGFRPAAENGCPAHVR